MSTEKRRPRKDYQRRVQERRLEQLDWLTDRTDATMRVMPNGEVQEEPQEEQAEEYVPYPRMPSFVVPGEFRLPSVISGFLLLRKLGLTRERRAELMRATGGLELDKLEKVLRVSEAEMFGSSNHSHSGYYTQEGVWMECEEAPEGAFVGEDEGLGPEGEHYGANEFEEDAEDDEEEVYLADDYEFNVEEDATENDIYVALSQDTSQADVEYHDSVGEVFDALVAWKNCPKTFGFHT